MKRRLKWVIALVLLTVVRTSIPRDDEAKRLAYLAERISHHDTGVAPGHPFDGEWRLITLSMTSIAAWNMARAHPEERQLRADQISEWARQMISEEVRAYDTMQWGSDPLNDLDSHNAHAGYLGHVVLAMDAACLLGGERDEDLHERLATALARKLDESESGLVETYPGEIYVGDNAVVAASLAQFDQCTKSHRFAQTLSTWRDKLEAKWVDQETGVLVFAPGQGARGSGAAWNSMFLAFVDDGFAAQQSDAMWKSFGDRTLLGWLRGLREWPIGKDGPGDVDSGPLIAGISPSATGFALGDSAMRGRTETDGLLRTAELVGFTFRGRYVLSPLVGDAITLAARTMTFPHPDPLPRRGEGNHLSHLQR